MDDPGLIFGYDWPRLHAALNDLPAALLPVAVLFELLGLLLGRETLRSAAYWCLVAGVGGAVLAIGSGLQAEDAIEHGEAAHRVMEVHERAAFVTTGAFAVLLVWRHLRDAMGRAERVAWLLLAVLGVAMVIGTAKLGGQLVFDHGMGVKTEHEHPAGAPHTH